MTDSLLELETELKRVQSLPRTDIICQLMRHGNVDKLTQLKMKLTSQCQKTDEFPKGEPYLRRRPRERSTFSSLEERLANDIFELHNFLDTGCVTGEIKAMFKSNESSWGENSTLEELEQFIEDSFHTSNIDKSVSDNNNSNNNTLTQAIRGDSQTQRQRSDNLAKMEANFFIFREKVESQITDLLDKLSEKDKIIEKHDEDLCKLREQNLNLKSRIAKLEEQQQYPSTMSRGNKGNNPQKDNSANYVCETNCEEFPFDEIDVEEQNRNTLSDPVECHTEASILQNVVEPVPDKVVSPGNNTTHSKELYTSYSHVLLRSPSNITSVLNENPINLQNAEAPDLISDKNNANSEEFTESANTELDGFIGVKRHRKKVKRFFIGGIKDNVSAEQILSLAENDINPTQLRLFKSKRQGTLSAKLNILATDYPKITKENFWPKFVVCKPWVTKGMLEKNLRNTAERAKTNGSAK